MQALNARSRHAPSHRRAAAGASAPHRLAARRRAPLPRATPADLAASGLDLAALPKEALALGGAALLAALGAVGAVMGNQQSNNAAGAGGADAEGAGGAPAPPPRKNAVLVFGASGRAGRLIVKELLARGRTVVAAARGDGAKAREALASLGLEEGAQPGGGGGALFVDAGVDVTDESTLTADLFEGVTQVVSALGGVTGRLPDGSFGYVDGLTPEAVEAGGVANIVAAMKKHVAPQAAARSEVLAMRTAEDLEAWERLDDVIMGGNSSSGLAPAADGSGAVWRGDLVLEGGGFCGARTRPLGLDLSAYDGLALRVASPGGRGQTFKLNVKTADQEDVPEATYQATFDTPDDGDFATVHLPWHSFVPVKRAQSDPQGEPLTGESISKLGLVLSRFEFNKAPNPRFQAGKFELQIAGGVQAFKAPRPQLVLLSSAGVERNALVGDDAEARQREIPIVRLNPGGVLNWKYEAECAARASGYAYAVVRCTGLDDGSDEAAGAPRLLEADQGDAISGRVSRREAAAVIAAALDAPEAARKTFELRRSEAADAAGKAMGAKEMRRLFLKLAPDAHRWRVGLQPFPKPVPPPAPPSEEAKAAILADPQVQAVRDRQQRLRAGLNAGEGAAQQEAAALGAAGQQEQQQQQQQQAGEGASKEAAKEEQKEMATTRA